jgi:hypothetical protein
MAGKGTFKCASRKEFVDGIGRRHRRPKSKTHEVRDYSRDVDFSLLSLSFLSFAVSFIATVA